VTQLVQVEADPLQLAQLDVQAVQVTPSLEATEPAGHVL